jgi:cyclic pyranopterin phosphate synthase
MRISVTDRCNLRCAYCSPSKEFEFIPHSEILTYEEIVRLSKIAVSIGIEKFRLTGGEPLLRKNISFLIEQIVSLPKVKEVTLTTNGVLLSQYVDELWEVGLRRLNISLDTLDPKKYRELTGRNDFHKVWGGIEAALNKGFNPLKINVVLLKGINDDISPFINLTLDYPLHIRFIELMDFAPSRKNFFVSCTVALMRLKEHGKFEEVSSLKGAGPARYYRLKGAKGTLGFICPYTEHFCESCNRLRISADGKMKPCLFSDFSVDLKRPLREGATDEEIKTLILKALKSKPEKRGVNRDKVEGEGMRRIGG